MIDHQNNKNPKRYKHKEKYPWLFDIAEGKVK
jgi:hypothetical protein